jgi:hypothetical protein
MKSRKESSFLFYRVESTGVTDPFGPVLRHESNKVALCSKRPELVGGIYRAQIHVENLSEIML